MPTNSLTKIDFESNNISHFQVSKFFPNFESQELKILLANNNLESLDFRFIDENSINQSLTIDVGNSPIKCNCETTNFYEFLQRKFFKNDSTYEMIKIEPEVVKCREMVNGEIISVVDMDRESIICPLDTKHRVVCPTSCRCLRRPVS